MARCNFPAHQPGARQRMTSSSAFAGEHRFFDDLGNAAGRFVVFRIDRHWYWQERPPHGVPIKANPFGPFPDAETAYLAATGD